MLRRLMSIVVVALCAIAISGSAHGAPTFVNTCPEEVGGGIASAPTSQALECHGHAPSLENLAWSGWGTGVASGSGVRPLPWACNADDVSDSDACWASPPTVPATIRLWAPAKCFGPKGVARFYTRLEAHWTIPDGTSGYVAGPGGGVLSMDCPRPSWAIGRAWIRQIGPIRKPWATISDVSAVLGTPRMTSAPGQACFSTWGGLGLRAYTVAFGDTSVCDSSASLWNVEIRDRRWHLWNGIRVGSPVGVVRKKAIRRCHAGWECGFGSSSTSAVGYVMAQKRSECSATIVPTVVARIARGRVSKIILTGNCE